MKIFANSKRNTLNSFENTKELLRKKSKYSHKWLRILRISHRAMSRLLITNKKLPWKNLKLKWLREISTRRRGSIWILELKSKALSTWLTKLTEKLLRDKQGFKSLNKNWRLPRWNTRSSKNKRQNANVKLQSYNIKLLTLNQKEQDLKPKKQKEEDLSLKL